MEAIHVTRTTLYIAAAGVLLATIVLVGLNVAGDRGHGPAGQTVSSAVVERSQAPVPSGEPQGPLVSISKAASETGVNIRTPSYLPPGYQLEGAWVPSDGSHARLHFAGPRGDLILIEAPSNDKGRAPEGLEFSTQVNGYPAIGVKGDVPPTETGPTSQIEWWTGQVLYDLYGPISYEEIERVGDSVAGSAG